MESFLNLDFDSPKGGASAVPSLFGGAAMSIEAMTTDEFNAAADQVYARVRQQAFSHGLPVVVKIDGVLVNEFADGHLEPITQ